MNTKQSRLVVRRRASVTAQISYPGAVLWGQRTKNRTWNTMSHVSIDLRNVLCGLDATGSKKKNNLMS